MKFLIKILKKFEYLSAISVRLTKLTGKSQIPLHPKHLIKSDVWFNRFLSKNDLVLDLGCNSGQISFKIAKKVTKVIGFEIDERLIKTAQASLKKNNIKNVEFLQGDANERLPFKNNCFDKVICSDVLEHLEKRDFALSEIRRVLKPNGILFLVTDNPDTSWKKLQRSAGLFYYADPDHKYEYPKTKILDKLKKQKFDVISVDTVTYDTPLKGLIDVVGGLSLTFYMFLGNWRMEMVKKHPNDTTGYKIIAQKDR